MAGIHGFTEKVIDYAERLSDVADAAQGKRRRNGGLGRWMLLPASGAALLALVRSDFVARQAKEVFNEAKTRASDLPDELMDAVRQTATTESGNGGSASRSRASQGKTSSRSGSTRKTGTRKRSPTAKRASGAR